jgi:asparagine synthase (glutamine-hydrolysing)
MCGIAGYYCLDETLINPTLLKKMGDALAHRGPDGEGFWQEGAVGLAHRRLAVIDLSEAAAQPMVSRCGRYVLSYNGEIYNFIELKKELIRSGNHFTTQSDTEVLLVAWQEWGVGCLARLNGMFAFSIFDRKKRELYLCRDRYGIKPLYFLTKSWGLVFASEIKAILQHGAIEASLNLSGLIEYFTFQNFFSEQTLFEDVHMLPPGAYLKFDERKKPSIKQWWEFRFKEPAVRSTRDEYLEELDRLFRQAVKRQLVSDVPVASYLSGGIDSAAIATVAASELSDLNTFTIGFDLRSAQMDELKMDERAHAAAIAKRIGGKHYERIINSREMLDCLPSLAYHIEEPRVGQSYPNFYAAQLASSKNKVVLAGTGGDELFAGYPWRYYYSFANKDFEEYIDRYYGYWQRLLPNKEIRKAFLPIQGQIKDVWTQDIFRGIFGEDLLKVNTPAEYINHSLSFEAKTFLHGLLVVEDKLSMAHGIETRVPFLDNDLVDFATQIPVELKLANIPFDMDTAHTRLGEYEINANLKAAEGKVLLREMVAKYLPTEDATRSKQGFSAPDASWFRFEVDRDVRALFVGDDVRLNNFMDKSFIQQSVDDHLCGKKNNRLLIWSLMSVEFFLRTFI